MLEIAVVFLGTLIHIWCSKKRKEEIWFVSSPNFLKVILFEVVATFIPNTQKGNNFWYKQIIFNTFEIKSKISKILKFQIKSKELAEKYHELSDTPFWNKLKIGTQLWWNRLRN